MIAVESLSGREANPIQTQATAVEAKRRAFARFADGAECSAVLLRVVLIIFDFVLSEHWIAISSVRPLLPPLEMSGEWEKEWKAGRKFRTSLDMRMLNPIFLKSSRKTSQAAELLLRLNVCWVDYMPSCRFTEL